MARVRARVSGGFTALQVWQRLPAELRADLGDDGPVAERRGVEQVRSTLDALVSEGRVVRRRVEMTVPLNTKGPRSVVVDAYRFAGGAR